MHRTALALVFSLTGCSAITLDAGDGGEVWMAQQFEWGDRCGSDSDAERPLVLSWLEEEGIHVTAVERRRGNVSENSCAAHRETVYVLAPEADRDRLDAMGFSVRMPPPR